MNRCDSQHNVALLDKGLGDAHLYLNVDPDLCFGRILC